MAKKSAHNSKKALSFEDLESRRLMTSGISATLSGTTLNISGTDGNDNVAVRYDGWSQKVTAYADGKRIGQWDKAQIQAINADFQRGVDKVALDAVQTVIPGERPTANSNSIWHLTNVKVNFGRGGDGSNREAANITNVKIDQLRIIGTSTNNGVNLQLKGVNVGVLNADLSPMSDYVGVSSKSYIDQFFAKFGAGDDRLEIRGEARIDPQVSGRTFYTQINRADIKMGRGRDHVLIDSNSNILSGAIDGGSSKTSSDADHEDRLDILHRKQTVSFSKFEKVVRPRR